MGETSIGVSRATSQEGVTIRPESIPPQLEAIPSRQESTTDERADPPQEPTLDPHAAEPGAAQRPPRYYLRPREQWGYTKGGKRSKGWNGSLFQYVRAYWTELRCCLSGLVGSRIEKLALCVVYSTNIFSASFVSNSTS
jgi:hypothetical protein